VQREKVQRGQCRVKRGNLQQKAKREKHHEGWLIIAIRRLGGNADKTLRIQNGTKTFEKSPAKGGRLDSAPTFEKQRTGNSREERSCVVLGK